MPLKLVSLHRINQGIASCVYCEQPNEIKMTLQKDYIRQASLFTMQGLRDTSYEKQTDAGELTTVMGSLFKAALRSIRSGLLSVSELVFPGGKSFDQKLDNETPTV